MFLKHILQQYITYVFNVEIVTSAQCFGALHPQIEFDHEANIS